MKLVRRVAWILRKIEAHDRAIVAVATIFIALFTVLLAVATAFLWCATRELVQGADDTAKRQLRAYVTMSAEEVRNFNTTSPLTAIIRIKNSGRTPAYNVSNRTLLSVTKYPLADFYGYDDWKPSTAVLGPDGELDCGVTVDKLTPELTAAVIKGDFAVYFFVEIKYFDAFKTERIFRSGGYFKGHGVDPGPTLKLTQTADRNDAN